MAMPQPPVRISLSSSLTDSTTVDDQPEVLDLRLPAKTSTSGALLMPMCDFQHHRFLPDLFTNASQSFTIDLASADSDRSPQMPSAGRPFLSDLCEHRPTDVMIPHHGDEFLLSVPNFPPASLRLCEEEEESTPSTATLNEYDDPSRWPFWTIPPRTFVGPEGVGTSPYPECDPDPARAPSPILTPADSTLTSRTPPRSDQPPGPVPAPGRGSGDGSCSLRPVDRRPMRVWLHEQLDKADVPGLEWVDKAAGTFRVPWKHGSRHGWTMEYDACLFLRWAKYTGRYSKSAKPEARRWKANFRSALNSLPGVELVRGLGQQRGTNASRVYRFKDVDAKVNIRRRVGQQRLSGRKTSTNQHNDRIS